MKVGRVLHNCSRLLRHNQSVASVNHARHFTFWEKKQDFNKWKQAVSDAEKIVGYPTSFMSLRCLLSDELANAAVQVRKLVGTRHPLLKTARGFLEDGKHSMQIRGLIVLLMAKAGGPKENTFDEHEMVSGIYPKQRQLAEITEMINTAYLIHRGVINLDTLDETDSYKDMEFGNKIAVLIGDFLLANTTYGLSELHNSLVVEMMSKALSDISAAEFTRLRDRNGNAVLPDSVVFSDWERQTLLQSGSLMAKSCQASLELVKHEEELQMAAAKFGENLAYARQMHDDILLFKKPITEPNGILSSAPLIRHIEEDGYDNISNNSTPQQVISSVQHAGKAVDWCVNQCQHYVTTAIEALDGFETGEAKTALMNIAQATTDFK